VLDCYLNDEEVQSFPSLSIKEQGRLIFSRYVGLLIDAKSTPDENGFYFDFSAVPMPTTSFDNGEVLLPRILEEDIYHII